MAKDKATFMKLLKIEPEVEPDQHDGSYQLVRATVEALGHVPPEALGIEDLDMLYLMTILTSKSSYSNKQDRVRASHLLEEDKTSLISLIDELHEKTDQGAFNKSVAADGEHTMGMFGTGFYTYNKPTSAISQEDISGFIAMCVEILNSNSEEQALDAANHWFTKEIKGLATPSISQILHCLKPTIFPVLNSPAQEMYKLLDVKLDKEKMLQTYPANVKKIREFRNQNLPFKNYRGIDLAYFKMDDGPPPPPTPVNIRSELNTIFYGPPGTGKTYGLVDQALAIIDPQQYKDLINQPLRRDQAVKVFNELCTNGQIEVCTFHQSYSYEEFVEGWRGTEAGGFQLEDGVFKRICNAALSSANRPSGGFRLDENNTDFFKMSLGNTYDGPEIYDYCISNNQVAMGWGEDVDFTGCGDSIDEVRKCFYAAYPPDKFPEKNPFNIQAIHYFRNLMRKGDIVVVSSGNQNARAIGRITGEYVFNKEAEVRYMHFRQVEWLVKDLTIPVNQILIGKQFSQMTIYRLDKKDLNLVNIKRLVEGSDSGPKNFVLIIDEINRGNISKILGELVTLIEFDKRIGQLGEIRINLPYSGEKLGVPSNLYVIGSMNTADRSIALLDTALRRRFDFIEMMPDPDLLPIDVEGIKVREFLRVLNARIEFLYDRDHTIGHAYFMRQDMKLHDLQEIMQNNVVPLLQEYFYDDWERIEMVLGGAGIEGDDSYFISKDKLQANVLFPTGSSKALSDRFRYRIVSKPSKAAFMRLYGVAPVESEEE